MVQAEQKLLFGLLQALGPLGGFHDCLILTLSAQQALYGHKHLVWACTGELMPGTVHLGTFQREPFKCLFRHVP